MLFSQRVLRGVVEGAVTVAFRRWVSPQAREGTRVRTTAGVVDIGRIQAIDLADLTEADARQAGFESLRGLWSSLDKHGAGAVHRVELRYVGPDPDRGVGEHLVLTARELADIDRQLARYDVSAPRGPWTKPLLRLLRERPGVRASEVAATQVRPVSRVKSEVWKLSELGLVEKAATPLEREQDPPASEQGAARNSGGLRLSARGHAYLDGPQ